MFPELSFIIVVIVEVLYNPLRLDWMFPELVRVVIEAPLSLRNPYSCPEDIVPELFNSTINAFVLFNNPLFFDAEIVPELLSTLMTAELKLYKPL